MGDLIARRFRSAPRASVLGVEAAVADRRRLRAIGLMHLPRKLAPQGLLIPRCSSVHTLGMRFAIVVVFLDEEWVELERRRVPPRRIAARRGAHSVLEIPL